LLVIFDDHHLGTSMPSGGHPPHQLTSDWSDEETDNPLRADDRNFYKVEKWTKDGSKVDGNPIAHLWGDEIPKSSMRGWGHSGPSSQSIALP
jgi:hypothetical protein